MMHPRMALSAAVMLVGAAVWTVGAAEKPKRMPKLQKPAEPEGLRPLGVTVNLIFKIKDGELPSMETVCATDRYAIQTQFEGPKGYANVDISGRVQTVGSSPGTLLISYQTLIDFEGDGGMVHASALGSTTVKLGGTARLMSIAGKSLIVEAREVIDAAAEQ